VREVPVNRPLRKLTADDVYDETLSSANDTDPQTDNDDDEPNDGQE
jgi:hypothetical protein